MIEKVKQEIKDHPTIIASLIGGCAGYFYYKLIMKQIQTQISTMTGNQENTSNNTKDEKQNAQQKNEINMNRFLNTINDIDEDDHAQITKAPGDKIYKICLTGGPCAGKTSGLSYLSEKLDSQGYTVYVVPESATMIAQGGGMLDMSNYTRQQKITFQTQLMKTQMQLEQCFMRIAQLANKKSIVLCDRGLMDGSAYMDQDLWEEMLSQSYFTKNNLNETQLRDRQYDAVIHLVTAADGAEEHYNKSNQARHENVIQAMILDKKLQLAWLGHPHGIVIGNQFNSFEDKLFYLLQTVNNIIGLGGNQKMVKKRYLIDTQERLRPVYPKELEVKSFFVEDIFINYEKSNQNQTGSFIKVRRRGQNGQFIYIWSKSEIKGTEDKVTLKKMMTYKEYMNVLGRVDENRHPIVKNRVQFIWEGLQYNVDTFLNVGEGFSTVSVRQNRSKNLETDDAKMPPFIKVIRDITNDHGYKVKYLAKKDWYVPSGDEKIVNQKKTINMRKDSIDVFN